MDQCTRRIVGFGVHGGVVDGVALCRAIFRDILHFPTRVLVIEAGEAAILQRA
jgi:hypothetical protein